MIGKRDVLGVSENQLAYGAEVT